MSIAETIAQTLKAHWPDADIHVIDESHKHAGHAGAPEAGESHFHVKMASAAFATMSRIERHRAVNDALADLLRTQIHALRLSLGTPP